MRVEAKVGVRVVCEWDESENKGDNKGENGKANESESRCGR